MLDIMLSWKQETALYYFSETKNWFQFKPKTGFDKSNTALVTAVSASNTS